MAFEGLRELKKRETRQRISNVATGLFLDRGFDAVTIAEVAAAAGVSEKTVYNYFPTKESLVLDQIEGQVERLVTVVRDRQAGVTPTAALIAALKEETRHFYEMIPDAPQRLEEFSAMVRGTAALRAAWSEHRHQMVAAFTTMLAAELQVDAADPEPLVAARALVGLVELLYDSRLRHSSQAPGRSRDELMARIGEDLDRGARLLDTGMWSLHLMVEGRRTKDQMRDAAAVAEKGRQQVLAALRQAKRAWKEISEEARETGRDAARDAREEVRGAGRGAREAAKAEARSLREEAKAEARALKQEIKEQVRAQVREVAREARDQALKATQEAREQALKATQEAQEQARKRR